MRILFIIVLNFTLTCFAQVEITTYEQNILDRTEAEISVLQYDDFDLVGLQNANIEVSKFAKDLHQRLLASVENRYIKLIDTLPDTKLRNRFDYIMAQLYDRQFETEIAKKFYIKVISNPQNLLFSSLNIENIVRKNIYVRLAEIDIAKREFDSAIKYLDATKKIEIKYICGTAIQNDYERLKKLYEICEKK